VVTVPSEACPIGNATAVQAGHNTLQAGLVRVKYVLALCQSNARPVFERRPAPRGCGQQSNSAFTSCSVQCIERNSQMVQIQCKYNRLVSAVTSGRHCLRRRHAIGTGQPPRQGKCSVLVHATSTRASITTKVARFLRNDQPSRRRTQYSSEIMRPTPEPDLVDLCKSCSIAWG